MADRDLEQRVSDLEKKVDRLANLPARTEMSLADAQAARKDAAAARHLAAAADRDVEVLTSELRDFRHATTQSFNVTREDLADLRVRVEAVEGRLDRIEERLGGVEDTLSVVAAGQQQIVGMLTTLIERDEKRG